MDTIPDTETITPLNPAASRSFGPFGTGAVGGIRLSQTLMLLSPLLPLLFLLLITLLVVRTFQDFLRWWGIPLLISGIVALVIGLAGSSFFEPAWVALLTGRIPASFSVGLAGVVHDLLRAVMQTYWQGIESPAELWWRCRDWRCGSLRCLSNRDKRNMELNRVVPE